MNKTLRLDEYYSNNWHRKSIWECESTSVIFWKVFRVLRPQFDNGIVKAWYLRDGKATLPLNCRCEFEDLTHDNNNA